jgi:hypothetical protein
VAQWTSHPPQELKTRVRIPPGYKVFKDAMAMMVCIFYLICIVCVYMVNKGLATKKSQCSVFNFTRKNCSEKWNQRGGHLLHKNVKLSNNAASYT